MASYKTLLLENLNGELLFPTCTNANNIFHSDGTLLKTYMNSLKSTIMNQMFPVGSLLIVQSNTFDPNNVFPNTYWKKVGQGKILIGRGYLDGDSSLQGITSEEGDLTAEYRVRLTEETIPNHQHYLYRGAAATGSANYDYRGAGGQYNGLVHQGGGGSHENMMPYVVASFWKKISESSASTYTLRSAGNNIIKDLENTSWSAIAAASFSGEASKYWSIGDEKTITIGDYDASVRIVDIKECIIDSDGNTRDCLIFETTKLYKPNCSKDILTTNWNKSSLKKSLDNIKTQLPYDLQDVIQEISINNSYSNNLTAENVFVNLFIPSSQDYTSLSYYKNATKYNSQIRAKDSLNGNIGHETLRCVHSKDSVAHLEEVHSKYDKDNLFCGSIEADSNLDSNQEIEGITIMFAI